MKNKIRIVRNYKNIILRTIQLTIFSLLLLPAMSWATRIALDTFTDATNSFIETDHSPDIGTDWETPSQGIEQWVLEAGGADADKK